MVNQPVQPLHISKMSSTNSPSKLPRPLSEVGPNERRRNSPSYTQATRKMIVSRESASPFDASASTFRSPRQFWEKGLSPGPLGISSHASENTPERSPSPLPSPKRSSIENLKKASRVANSPMFDREKKDKYDPSSSSPIIERPLTDRPLSDRIQQNPFSRYDSIRKENNPFKSPETKSPEKFIHLSTAEIEGFEPSQTSAAEVEGLPAPPSTITSRTSTPSKEFASPTKSSLTAKSRYANPPVFDPENEAWSGEEESRSGTPLASLRPAKSVTFGSTPEINEYEQQTPEPSSEAGTGSRESSYDSDEYDDSFERGASAEDEDSFDASLEDTEKTPVVLPGDWINTSPDTARTALVNEYDDVFDDDAGSPAPSATPSKTFREALESARSESVTSDGSTRPLPPIPGFSSPTRGRESTNSLAAAAERASSVQRNLSAPPRPAATSKDDIFRMREATMTLEDRMALLALQEDQKRTSFNLREKKSTDTIVINEIAEDDEVGDLPDFDYAPMISRESILRKVKSDMHNETEEGGGEYSDPEVDYSELARVDPDVAIPSRENSTHFNEAAAMAIKDEPEDSDIDIQDVPEAVFDPDMLNRSPSRMEERQSSIVHHDIRASTESGSRYSNSTVDAGMQSLQGAGLGIYDEFSTPLEEPRMPQQPEREMSLPLFTNLGNDFDFGLKDYMTPTAEGTAEPDLPPAREVKLAKEKPLLAPIATDLRESMGSEHDESELPLHERIEVPVIPERKATIKTGGKLKARPSGSRADLEALLTYDQEQPVPAVPEQYRNETQDISETAETESIWSQPSAAESGESKNDSATEQESRPASKRLDLNLSLPVPEPANGSGFSLSEEMERVMETQKVRDFSFTPVLLPAPNRNDNQSLSVYDRITAAEDIKVPPFLPHSRAVANKTFRTQKGYLMRQNTKVVIASNRNFSGDSVPPKSPAVGSGSRSAGNSPRKSSGGEKFIQTEPWNGKVRRKSSRRSSGGRKSYAAGPAPPLPGHESALGVLNEYSTLDNEDEEIERGRLFVKVVSVKDLDLPLPRNDRLYFQLTLDNGLHCVTTANLDLNRSAAIGQEFELVVLQDLDFQLTLTTNLPPAPKPQPMPTYSAPVSPTKPKSPTKSVFSRLLSSPRKRAENERRERAEAEEAERRRQEEHQRRQAAARPTTWDKLRELVDANTGSFGRSYVSLKSYEEQCFGRLLTVDVPLFNEWAVEKDSNVVNSVRSKRGNNMGTVRRPPYTVGSLEVQLLYIPKPKDATDEDMPKSMSGAVREMDASEKIKEVKHEGALSQQGGDCPYWRRRYFKLNGTKLTAYHEHTMQPRATINLSKASRLIDDKSSLVADPTSGSPSKGRRKSAFAEEDDGYQFVEEGFRIRFANGETIDFYADDAAQKNAWMDALSQAVGKPSDSKAAKWTDLVLSRERTNSTTRPKSAGDASTIVGAPDIRIQAPSRDSSMRSTQLTSSGSVIRKGEPANGPDVPAKDEERAMIRPGTPPLEPRSGHRERKEIKSMIY